MNILCVIDSLCMGGAQRQMVELAGAFCKKGHRVDLLTYHDIPFFKESLIHNGITIHCIEASNYIKRLLKIRKFIRKGPYDAVLSFLEGPNFICEFAGIPFRRWKLVVGERNADPQILHSIKLKFFRWFHFFADYVVANSKANIRLVQKVNPLLRRSKCRVIYNIVDFKRFRPSENNFKKRAGKISLVIAARIDHQKNVSGLIEALALLENAEREKIVLDWYGEVKGDPEAAKILEEAMEQLKRKKLEQTLVFHASIRDIPGVFRGADAVGLFSLYEGFPNVFCEAMACEKPVIGTMVSDIPEFLFHEPGLLCDPREPDSIKNALVHLLHMDEEQLRKAALTNRQVALEKFNKERIVAEYLRLLGDGAPGKSFFAVPRSPGKARKTG